MSRLITSIFSNVAKNIIGDDKYNLTRDRVTWSWSAFQGFSPVPTLFPLAPVKIALFIIFVLICIFAFGIGWWSVPVAYVAQAVIIMISAQWIIDKFLYWNFGV